MKLLGAMNLSFLPTGINKFIRRLNGQILLLTAIIMLAIVLRFIGIQPGYDQFHPDETVIYTNVINFVENGNFKPFMYGYPALTFIINFIPFKLFVIPFGFLKFYILNLGDILDGMIKIPLGLDTYNKLFLDIIGKHSLNILFLTRWVTAVFGVGVVGVSYLVGKKLFGNKAGIISALLVCVNYRQILYSHLTLPEIYNAFFLLLSFWSILRLREKASFGRSLICGLFLGFSLSTKYQYFTCITFFFVYLEQLIQKWNIKDIGRRLFNPYYILVPIVTAAVFLLINPYLFINMETFLASWHANSSRYGAGVMNLSFYSYSYLYKIGIGKITSFAVIIGILLSFWRDKWKSILLLSAIIPFMFFFTYYTNGGLYTRNFVTVTPIILIYAAYAISKFVNFKSSKTLTLFALVILVFAVRENLINDVVLLQQYIKSWNWQVTEKWIADNVPEGSTIAAHSSVHFPSYLNRINYSKFNACSLSEFREQGAQYAVANLETINTQYFSWMGPLKYWNKPVLEMKQEYTSLTIDELTDFGLIQIVKPWQAPDGGNFVIAKVPYYSLISKEEFKVFNFPKNFPVIGWHSEPISINNWSGFEVDYGMLMQSKNVSNIDGVIFIKFYLKPDDALMDRNRVAVRLSSRNNKPGEWQNRKLIGVVPDGAKYITLGFIADNEYSATFQINKIELYKAKIIVDLGGANVKKIMVDDNLLFPNSISNL